MKTMGLIRLAVMFLLCLRLQAENTGFSGVWKTRHGMMRLMEKDGRVTGCYKRRGLAEIEGSVAENVLTFSFREANGEKGTGGISLGSKRRSIYRHLETAKGQGRR